MGDGEMAFEEIPLTESLFSSLEGWMGDERLVHLIVTDGGAPFVSAADEANPYSTSTQPVSIMIQVNRH